MDFSVEEAKANLKSVITSEKMMDALNYALKRYIEHEKPLLDTLTTSARMHKVVKSDLSELVRECVPTDYILYRSQVMRRKR